MSGNKGNKELEMEVFDRFSRIVKEKFTSLSDDFSSSGSSKVNDLDVLYGQPEFNAEKRVLGDMNRMGLSKGVLSGLACFAFLRFSPKAIARMLQRRAAIAEGTVNPFNQSSGYKLDPPADQTRPERPGLLFRAVRLCLDTFVSLSIGAYASLYFVDKKKMMNQFADIPLIEGRSLLSETLCGDFTQEFRKIDRQVWEKTDLSLNGGVLTNNDGEHDFRNTIQGFVANCRRRELHERELRREQGLRDDEPVVIHSPGGVPRDISVSLADLLGEKEFGETNMDTGDFFDSYFDTPSDEEQDSFSS